MAEVGKELEGLDSKSTKSVKSTKSTKSQRGRKNAGKPRQKKTEVLTKTRSMDGGEVDSHAGDFEDEEIQSLGSDASRVDNLNHEIDKLAPT